jgi:hypothetical protein
VISVQADKVAKVSKVASHEVELKNICQSRGAITMLVAFGFSSAQIMFSTSTHHCESNALLGDVVRPLIANLTFECTVD